MLKTIVGALALITLALGVAAPSGAAAEAKQAQPLFEWGMPSGYPGKRDARGGIVETQPYEVRPGPWTVYLRTVGPACARGVTHSWIAGNGKELKPKPLSPCRYSIRFAREGERTIRLDARRGRVHLGESQQIPVEDRLIVAIGDSVASGEGVPDEPSLLGRAAWQSARCHRSARAGVALAARQIEDDDGHSSVTFVHLACSGAEVPTGLLGPYAGAAPPRDEPPLEPQVSVLERIAEKRDVDAVLISIGGNDIHFSEVTSFCASVPNEDCFGQPLPRRFGGDGVQTARQAIEGWLRELEGRYDRLAARLESSDVPASRVYITEYFDPTHDERGSPCERILGSIATEEVEQARTRMLAPLNGVIERAAGEHDWNMVGGISALFRTHGYCAGKQRWVSSLGDSLRDLGGPLGDRHRGTLHPNAAGHEAIAALVSAHLEHDLYPGRVFPPRPFPSAQAGGNSGIGSFLAGLATSLLLGSLTLPLAVVGGIAALLWEGREVGSPILLGAAAGVALLLLARKVPPRHFDPPPALEPLASLLRTIRPLLLPLLVVLAVGTVKLCTPIQFVAGLLLVLASWRLVVAPEARKSGVKLGWRLRLVAIVAIFSAIAVAVGALAVLLTRGLWTEKAYFETIGDLASGLLLLAVLLWVIAFLFRLFSFATTPLRALMALDIGLALTIGAMAVGVVPGDQALIDAWPRLLGLFAGIALALLAVETVRSAIAGEARKVRRGITSHAAEIGFGAAAVSALVLAVATGYGMVDAAEKGQLLNPPEEEIAGLQTLPPAAVSGDGGVELARRYAPVLVFTEDERWAPIRVDSYVAGAKLSGPPGTPPEVDSLAGLAALPSCPESARRACYALSIGCESGGDPCARGRFRQPGRLYRDGAAYVRVLDKPGPPGEPRGVFVARGPYRDRLATLIQYWYFYRYNEWQTPVFAGLLTQRHEADWEAVTIGLDAGRRPLFVANSAHCAGSWSPWREVEASALLPGPRVHPLVAVAEGSHANYPDPEEKRAPDWTSCKDAPDGITTAISYASNIRDRTEYGWLWFPRADGWIKVTGKTPPMSFPGRWGDPGGITLRNFKSNPIGGPEDAPATPTLQPLWKRPVATIFCGRFRPRECTSDGE